MSMIKRIPVRFTYDNSYFNNSYQGIPVGGSTRLVAEIFKGVEVDLNVDYFENRAELNVITNRIIFIPALSMEPLTINAYKPLNDSILFAICSFKGFYYMEKLNKGNDT